MRGFPARRKASEIIARTSQLTEGELLCLDKGFGARFLEFVFEQSLGSHVSTSGIAPGLSVHVASGLRVAKPCGMEGAFSIWRGSCAAWLQLKTRDASSKC